MRARRLIQSCVIVLPLLAGCESQSTTSAGGGAGEMASAGGSHSHDHDHDHGHGAHELAVVNFSDGVKLSPANTRIEFIGSKDEGSHEGGFEKFSGTMKLGPDSQEINLEIDTASLWSDNAKLTGHLKNADFFDVPNHPTATFVATSVKESDAADATHEITGDLTLHGETKSITIPAQVSLEEGAHSLRGEFKIDKREFGMTYGEGQIHPDVKIIVEIGKGAA